MARVLHMSYHRAEGTVRSKSSLVDDDFSPMWADAEQERMAHRTE